MASNRLFCHGVAILFPAIVLFGQAAQAQVPVVFKVSEGVRPKTIVSLYGEYLSGTPAVRFLKSDGTVAATQTAVQTDRGGHFCRVVFPAIAPGAYRLAVQNGDGWSTQKIYVNRPDPRWISEERAYGGMPLKLIGRNLDAVEYQGAGNTQIRLVSVDGGGKAVVIAPQAVSPYCVDFSVPAGVAAGKYYVEVCAHSAEYGGDWVRLDNHSEFPDTVRDTVVQVEAAPSSAAALALKTAWANDFNWSYVANAKSEFHAQGDAVADDTQAIQDALEHVGRDGGGVVFLPKGVYRVSSLVLGSGCILQGESREGTVVMVSKTGDDGAIVLKGSGQGICTMTLKYQPSVPADSQAMLLAGAASKVFLHNIKFDMLRNPDVSVQQSPYYFTGSGPLLVANCQFYLSSRNLWDHAVKNRVTFRDNFIDMHDGLGLCMSSEKLLVLGNELTFHPAAYAGQMNGFFLNEGWVGWNIYNAYVADNNAHDLNGPGDCQPYAADSAWSCFAGAVTGAAANTVDVRNDVSGDFKGLDTHELELLVVQGKGLGQIRRMSAHQDLGGDPAVVRFTVSPPWDVPPDGTSVITAGSWHVNNVFFRNTARGSKSPYNMYYGGCYDCIDAEATSDNTEGWNNWGRIGEMPQGNWHCPVYFNQLKRSVFTGLAPKFASMGITLRVENETKIYRGIADYGTEICDNTIDRAACSNKNQRLAGNAAIATFNQSWMTVTDETPLLFATLCEGNRIKNSAVGFDLNGSFSLAIRGTVFENCPKEINDNGHDTALLPGNNTDWFKDARCGVFMHFLPGDAAGLAAVDKFDVDKLAAQLESADAKYFVLTLGQNSGYFNAPNAAYDKRAGYAAGERCSKRDLPLDLYQALRAKGIRLMLYLPCQTPNHDAQAQKAFGLRQGPADQPIDLAFADKWAEVIQQWSDRYGERVAGWWFDGGYEHIRFSEAIAQKYAAAVKHGNPQAIVTFNPGVKVIHYTQAEDYTAGELNEPFGEIPSSRFLEGSQWHVLTYLGSGWARRDVRYPSEKWARWAKEVVARQGVVTLDAGPNWDCQAAPIGALAEEQVRQLRAIHDALDAVR